MRGAWEWYMARAIWLRIVLAVVAVFVLLVIIGAFIPSDDEATPTAEPPEATEALVRDQASPSPQAAAVPAISPGPSPTAAPTSVLTPAPTLTAGPTPMTPPTPAPEPPIEERIAKSVRDGRSFMPRASTDTLAVEVTPTGLVIIRIEPSLLNETDALTVASQTALVANRAIWGTPFAAANNLSQLRLELLNEVIDANGAKAVRPVTFLQFNRATAQPFQYDGLKQRVTADNKHMYCLANNCSIAPFVYAKINDKGCLRGAVR